jgi:hypothetical protein
MGQQGIAAAHRPPDGVFLMWPQLNRLIHAGKFQMTAIKTAQTQIVVGIVIQTDQPLRAVGIGKDPGPKLGFQLFLFLASRQGGFLIHDPFFMPIALDGVVEDAPRASS